MDKKGFTAIIATSLLIVVTVITIIGYQTWFGTYSSNILVQVETNSYELNEIEIEALVGNMLYLKNNYNSNLSIDSIKIGNRFCNFSQNILWSGINSIEINNCTENFSDSIQEILIISNNSLSSKKVYINYNSKSLSNNLVNFVCNNLGDYGFNGGNGSISSPYEICNCNQLQNISQSLDSNYILLTNIDCNDTKTWNGNNGFIPIGTSSNYFNGSFNGNNYEINNLNIYRTATDYVGLFGYISNSIISNVNLKNLNISGANYVGGIVGQAVETSKIQNVYTQGNLNGVDFVGGIAGEIYTTSVIENSFSDISILAEGSVGGICGFLYGGEILNSNSSVNINISSGNYYLGGIVGKSLGTNKVINSHSEGILNGYYRVGGIIGEMSGTTTVYTTLKNCSSSNDISGYQIVGGIVGNQAKGYIRNSCFKGIINATNGYGGGISGSLSAYVSNSYSSGKIFGTSYIGGISGMISLGSISNSYSVGEITGNSNVGGIVGYVSSGAASFTFWDINSSGQSSSATGIGKSTIEMQNLSTYSGWDILDVENNNIRDNNYIWNIVNGTSYPFLSWE